MGKALDSAYINISVDDKNINLTQTSFSFTMFDSIYRLYPLCKFIVSDSTGILNEYLAFINGTKLNIKFGKDEQNFLNCVYNVYQDCIPEQETIMSFGGKIVTNLVHNYMYYQNKKSKIYNNTNISNLVEDLVREYAFNKISIDSTHNTGMWIQPYMNDDEFIINNLMPFAYSPSSKNSPFYCFINSNNEFNFRNFNSLISQSPVEKLVYTNKSEDSMNSSKIVSVKLLQTTNNELKPNFNRLFYNFDENGEYNYFDNSLITDFPSNKKHIPIKADLNFVTDVNGLLDYDIDLNDSENNNNGYKANLLKKSMLVDKLICMTDFNPNLCSGKVVSIEMPSPSNDGNSLRYSGDYLIESCYHVWSSRSAYTQFICGKQNITVSGDYKNKNLILQ